MARPSSIDKLPEPIRAEIGKLRGQGWTIDQILEHLRGLYDKAPSRSALGRHIQSLEKIGEQMRRSRQVTEALVHSLGDEPESRAARLNIELMHGAVLDLFLKATEGGGEIDADGKAALAGNPEGVMLFAKALHHLAAASKINVDFIAKAKEQAEVAVKKSAATAVERVARERGLTADTLAAIKAGIFGVKAA